MVDPALQDGLPADVHGDVPDPAGEGGPTRRGVAPEHGQAVRI